MSSVLVVAYYFPPLGGAGTQRFAKFCKYLPEHGLSTVVLTTGAVASRYAPHDDPSLEDSSMAVERVDAPARARPGQRLARALRLHLDEDEWAAAAEARAVELVREQRLDAVVTTVSPFACYRIGQRLKREFGMPWVLDLRDPWSLDGWRQYRSWLHAAWDLRHMRTALAGADYVIANVPEAAKALVAMGAPVGRTVVIPNGFDAPDFAGELPTVLADDGNFHLVHMGTFHAADAPEGLTQNRLLLRRHRQVSPLGRTGYYLLHAMRMLRERSPAVFARLRFDLFGPVDSTHRELIDRLRLGDNVVLHGYVPHRESVAALCGADAVFVPLHGVPAGERALVVPGKLYEALASERAVLAALPPGDGADLVRMLRAGVVVPPTDAAPLSAALERLIESDTRGEPVHGCRREQLGLFSREHLTGLLAQVLTAAIRRETALELADPWSVLGATGSAAAAAQESA